MEVPDFDSGADKAFAHSNAKIAQNTAVIIFNDAVAAQEVEASLLQIVDISAPVIRHSKLDYDRNWPVVLLRSLHN
jgi:hypothetical protein